MEPCRLCLSISDKNMDVLECPNLVKNIEQCVSIQITPMDLYSKNICTTCVAKVESWQDFKTMCLNSQRILEAKAQKNNFSPGNDSLGMKNEAKGHPEEENNDVDAPYPCSGSESKTENILKEAASSHKLEAPTCGFCFKTFEYYTDYLDHQNTHNDAVFCCQMCPVKFTSRSLLVEHEKCHKIPCKICGTNVKKRNMKQHLVKHTDKFKCVHCSLTFTCGPLLHQHITAIHMKLKEHFCDTCGKGFATKSSLNLHLKIHKDEKQYKCDKCNFAGNTSVSLRIHISTHENGTHICEYCSKIFKSFRNLRDHLKRVHKSDKKFVCDICNMRFNLRYRVEQHKRTHTGMQPYHCSKCSKAFARMDGLKEHLRTHEQIEPVSCELCKKLFKTKRGLQRHKCS